MFSIQIAVCNFYLFINTLPFFRNIGVKGYIQRMYVRKCTGNPLCEILWGRESWRSKNFLSQRKRQPFYRLQILLARRSNTIARDSCPTDARWLLIRITWYSKLNIEFVILAKTKYCLLFLIRVQSLVHIIFIYMFRTVQRKLCLVYKN